MRPKILRAIPLPLFGAPVLAVALLGACSEPERPVVTAPLDVQFGGCAETRPGPTCLRPNGGRLTLWVDALPGTFLVEVDGEHPVELESDALQGGVRLSLALSSGGHVLSVVPDNSGKTAPWTLTVTPSGVPRWEERIRARIRAGELGEAAHALEAMESALPSQEGAVAAGLLGKLAMALGEAKRSEALLEEALSGLGAQSRPQAQTEFASVLLHSYLTLGGRLVEARRLLDTLPFGPHLSLESRYNQAYFRGVLASMSGDARSALLELKRAVELAQRLDDERRHRLSVQMLAVQLQRNGRRADARRLLESLVVQPPESPAGSCESVLVRNNLAWNSLLSLEAGESVPNPAASLVETLELVTSQCPRGSRERLNILLNLALARLHDGDLDGTRSALEEAMKEDVDPGLRLLLWKRELEARLSLEAGLPGQALATYAELETLAGLAWSPEASWRAVAGRARSQRAAGRFEDALRAYQEAERQLDSALLQMPLQEGREAFVAYRATATKQHIELLLELGGIEEAFEVARRSRARLSRRLSQSIRQRLLAPAAREEWYTFVARYRAERESIEQAASSDWQWPTEALEAIRHRRRDRRRELSQELDRLVTDLGTSAELTMSPLNLKQDEVALLFHPLTAGWVVFAKSATRISVSQAPCPSRDTLERQARCLLRDLHPLLAEAGRFRIMASGPFAGIDFHGLRITPALSLATRPVVYDLDLQERPVLLPGARQNVLIVSDPTGNLPAARIEGTLVEELFAKRAEVKVLSGSEAKASALREALAGADGFHLAGHATFEGRDGWESYIALAQGSRFTIEDVLALERAPQWVFLSGCNTGRVAGHSEGLESIGLAQAFLATGSEVVVAAARPIGDAAAAELSAAFYRHWLTEADPASALHRARRELAKKNPDVDWNSYRLIRG